MRSSVHRVEIDLQDPYEIARRGMMSRSPSRAIGWILTVAALTVGCILGWTASRSLEQTASPAAAFGIGALVDGSIQPGNPIGSNDPASQAPFVDPRPDAANPYDRPDGVAVQSLSEKAWPIVLHRAGDGEFYADMLLDNRIVTVRIDPTQAPSRLAREDLPLAAAGAMAEWQATDVVLEHLRLPPRRFAVVDGDNTESIIGSDLLDRYFTIDEQRDQLRLSPRPAD